MRFLLLAASVLFPCCCSSVAGASELVAGSRVTVRADGRQDYSPRIVRCGAESGLCLRDTRYDPPDNPVMPVAEGQRVDFPGWKISYVFHPDESGSVLNEDGEKIGSFTWSQ